MRKEKINEAELKQDIWLEYFKKFKYKPDWRGVDFVLDYQGGHILWAEAKKEPTDINLMFAQLIFTIYNVQKEYPNPYYLAVFDSEKIAFIPYTEFETLFDEMRFADFNWNVTPSNRNTKEFKEISSRIKSAIEKNNILFHQENLHDFKELVFYFDKDKKDLKDWINNNLLSEEATGPIKITDGNFNKVYNVWLEEVKSTIQIDWEAIRRDWGLLDSDFYLADLFSVDDRTIEEKLYILLKSDHYNIQKINKVAAQYGMLDEGFKVSFSDNQLSHNRFWHRYKRPPEEEYWDLIIRRRDLLVPTDIRERLGAFFTPPMWVSLAQQYMSDSWGDLDDFYIWDCAGGTGNLLQGLTNSRNLFISDINIENVYIMQGRIERGELNLLPNHCFQFDFLNDDFEKLPKGLKNIIDDEEKRKKLIIFINPPYAEAGTKLIKENKKGVATKHKIHKKYFEQLGKARNELFAQFLTRIYFEIPDCKIGTFSKLKTISASNFKSFREWFLAKLKKGFLVPANTFDNVNGSFPIGFQCWDTSIKKQVKNCKFDVYTAKFKGQETEEKKIILKELTDVKKIGKKNLFNYDNYKSINEWIDNYRVDKNDNVGNLCKFSGCDFQKVNLVHIRSVEWSRSPHYIGKDNLIPCVIYLAVSKVMKPTWLNDRDQFLYPNDNWKTDKEFKHDCLAYTLFHSANNIQSKHGVNHWIPFLEKEVGAKEAFESSFMTDFIAGKIKVNNGNGVFNNGQKSLPKREFSPEATAVFDAGRELWRYYHIRASNNPLLEYNVNASLYDIREYFQGRKNGRLNSKSSDNDYGILLNNLRDVMKILSEKIEPKVYEYGFLLD